MARGLVVVLFLVVLGSCAHEPPKPDPYMTSGLGAMGAWLTALPRCPPAKAALAPAAYRFDEGTNAVALRGHLTLSVHPECTQRACDTKCCNNCFPPWVVVPNASEGPRELGIEKPGTHRLLSAVVQDCKLEPMRQQLPHTEVFVSGFLEGDVIIRSSMCVIESPPAPPAPTP